MKFVKFKKCKKEVATQPNNLCDNCYDNMGSIGGK